jgi:thioredoxin-dependent peroxiredoxin
MADQKAELQGVGTVVGKKAPDFSLENELGDKVSLQSLLRNGPVMLVFYPGDFKMVCTAQLCNYRDHMSEFARFPIQVVGVSSNRPQQHRDFANQYEFSFPLLADPGGKVTRQYGCVSSLMFWTTSRGVVIINSRGTILYRYVERTNITRRKADEILVIIEELHKHKLLRPET